MKRLSLIVLFVTLGFLVQANPVEVNLARTSRPVHYSGNERMGQIGHAFVCDGVGYGELDYTYYDWQSNAGARTWTHVWPDGKVNFAYTCATLSDFSDRGTAIGTYDFANDTWIPSGGRVENEKTGFGSIAQYGTNGLVVAAHTANDCGVYIIPDKDNYTPGTIARAGTLDNTKVPTWPNVMTSGPNRNIIHVIATGLNDYMMYYYRSQDGGATWDKQNEILPYMTSEYGEYFSSNCCYWMETTEDNCLALVVNNSWSDGMVLYSYDDGETWERKVFFQHPNPHSDFTYELYFYPRWTSCQWDSQHHLHVLYEFMATSGEPGLGSYHPSIGGVAYWNETMPYNIQGNTQSAISGNLIPGQPFVMDSAYLRQDIYASWWQWPEASHEMWPEYVGYLTPLTDSGYPEDPYNPASFNIDDCSLHGNYNSGVCAFPVLCVVPDTDEMVALWSALDENHTDENGNYYYKLFARYSGDGGVTWSPMVHLTNDLMWNYNEFVYNQAAVVGRKLIVASQVDGQTGSYFQSEDADGSDNHYQGFVFDIDDLFSMGPTPQYTITVAADPANAGVVSGGGTYYSGNTCTLSAMPNEGYLFDSWTKNGNIVSTNPEFSFIATEDASFVAHFSDQIFTITASALPAEGGVVTGGGSFHTGEVCTLTATPNAGYGFFVWHQDGGAVSSNPTFSFSVVENAHFVAVFDEIIENYVITVMADPIEGGVVSGGGTFNAGNICTLSAVPNTGYNFVNWTKNGNVVSASPSFSFNVMENADYVAHFEMQTFTVGVNASPSEGGVVSGAGTYTYGSTATVTVTPNQNYVLLNWTDYGTEVSTESSFSFVVTENHQLIANLDFLEAVEQWEEGYVNVYPNPVNDKLTVEVADPILQYEVYSIDGTRIYGVSNICEKKLEINVKYLPMGTYLIRLTTDNTVLARRFMKQ